MKHFGIAVLGIVGALAFTATSASAAIVCNENGDCWHAKEKFMATIGNGLTTTITGGANTRGAAIGVPRVPGSNSNK